jgi:hypothetical protein
MLERCYKHTKYTMNNTTNNTETNRTAQQTGPQKDGSLVESTGFHVTGSVKITDADTAEVLLHKRIDE